eukprot:11830097-Heterocapsa_arctica.AAC.1
MPTLPVASTLSDLPPVIILPFVAHIPVSPWPGLASVRFAYRTLPPRPKWSRRIICCGTAAFPVSHFGDLLNLASPSCSFMKITRR